MAFSRTVIFDVLIFSMTVVHCLLLNCLHTYPDHETLINRWKIMVGVQFLKKISLQEQSQIDHFNPLIKTKCHPHIKFFVCSVSIRY